MFNLQNKRKIVLCEKCSFAGARHAVALERYLRIPAGRWSVGRRCAGAFIGKRLEPPRLGSARGWSPWRCRRSVRARPLRHTLGMASGRDACASSAGVGCERRKEGKYCSCITSGGAQNVRSHICQDTTTTPTTARTPGALGGRGEIASARGREPLSVGLRRARAHAGRPLTG